MTDVGDAAERLRAALADHVAGRKPRLVPADMQALLDFYDQHGKPEQASARATRTKPVRLTDPGNERLRELTGSLKSILGALDKMKQPDFEPQLQAILVPFARAIVALLSREIDEHGGTERQEFADANDAYKAIAAAQDDEDEAYHAAVRGRRHGETTKRDNEA